MILLDLELTRQILFHEWMLIPYWFVLQQQEQNKSHNPKDRTARIMSNTMHTQYNSCRAYLTIHWSNQSLALVSYMFLFHDRPWISPWIKSISNELDITIHMTASQLSGHCDVINNRLWRHQQHENWASETRGRCVNIVVFIAIYGFVMSCKK